MNGVLEMKSGIWNNEILNGPWTGVYSGYVISSYEEIEQFSYLWCNQTVIGFDLEWVNRHSLGLENDNGREFLPIAVMQLCITENVVILIQFKTMWDDICKFGLPESLSLLLTNSNILKVGVSVFEDSMLILNSFNIEMKGALDLRSVQFRNWKSDMLSRFKDASDLPRSLASLAKTYTGHEIPKVKAVRCSDWEMSPLTNEQIVYAMSDVIIALNTFEQMDSEIPIKEVRELIDTPFHMYVKSFNPEKPEHEFQGRKNPLYENCYMMSPEGELMTEIKRRVAEWYLKKELAVIESEDPFTIKLRFKPKGLANAGDDFYLSLRTNCCVVCSNNEKYVKFCVVPKCYRQHFGDRTQGVFIGKTPHDIVLLCEKCFEAANIEYKKLQLLLGEEYKFPLQGVPEHIKPGIKLFQRAQSAAKWLIDNREKVEDEEKIQIYCSRIQDYFDTFEPNRRFDISSDDLGLIHKMKLPDQLKVIGHGEGIAKTVLQGGDESVFRFVKRWRTYFIDAMEPVMLPENWSIGHIPLQAKVKNLTTSS